LFSNNSYSFNWNLYSIWEKGIEKQLIETSTDRFTWNTYKTETAGATSLIYPSSILESDSICFRINDIENNNSQNLSSSSLSNIQCIYSVSDFYFPGTLNPNSNNNTFRIYGIGYDKNRGLIEIFNRWGEKIFSTTNLETGWNATYHDEIVEMGNYVYKVTFYDQLNKFYVRTGTIMIIR
jgi:gliding motility-associated-like protein